MNRPAECINCLIYNRASDLLKIGKATEEDFVVLLDKLKSLIPLTRTEAFVESYNLIKSLTKLRDPYSDTKLELSRKAVSILSSLKGRKLGTIADALSLSAAANIIDTRVLGYEFSPEDFSEKELLKEPAINDTWLIDFEKISKIAYVLDNAGEHLIDFYIVNWLADKGYFIDVIVRKDPYEIDVTEEDIRGLEAKNGVNVIVTENSYPPLYIKKAGDKVRKSYAESDIVIAKGIANLEAYIDSFGYLGGKGLFLFRAKCDYLSKKLKVKKGSSVILSELKMREFF